LVLSNVLVSKLKVNDNFSVQKSFFKLSLENAVHILQSACSVKLPVFELSFVVKPWLRHPFEIALSTKLPVLKLTMVVVSISKIQNAGAMEDIC
jgi:hypothetical protein